MLYISHDYVTCVLDEIALEGLDGITLQGLWTRLSERPGLCVTSDNCFKSYIWNLIKRLKDVEMYELKEPRKDLVLFNRFLYVDPELGTVIDREEELEDIYPFSPVEDLSSGNRGSCTAYNVRQNVTEAAKKVTLEEAISRNPIQCLFLQWGNKLVFVANQKTRNNALQGDNIDPVMELTLIQYCVLERIGRSRYHGEVTIGRCSLQQIGIDAKSLFYIRKYLIDHKLITKQIFHLKSGLQNSSGSLLHITRYFVLRRPKALILTQKVVEILKSRPGHYAEYEEIRQILGLYYSLKKLMKTIEFQRLIKTDLKLPYRTVYPEAKPGEWRLKGVDKEKMVRVIQLINPDVDVEELWSKEEDEEDDSSNGSVLRLFHI
ncbi:hypothetical protein J437_LFUL015504 [Ladona fulva]|uniref:B-block binding subunit of TFIIIC domain-containing protein n=1 Tax=Ladona fulva TaxID=123851 RepID=A0A8K0P5V0_LADFU|nr:hypothetical protein J437_LFUL015504 [Ladona fulva]